MSTPRFLAALFLTAVVPAVVAAQDNWEDNLDRYPTGSLIAGQGGWEAWDNNPAFNTIVTDAQSVTPPNSLLMAGAADVLQQFTNVEGPWDLYVQVYIPSTQTGEVWVRLANTYAPGGPKNFSVRLVMCVSACTTPGALPGLAVNMGGSEVPAGDSAPLTTDQWVEVHVVINSTPKFGYQYSLIYGDQFLGNYPWGVTAPPSVEAIDFLSIGSSPSYMDNFKLLAFIPVELMSFTVS